MPPIAPTECGIVRTAWDPVSSNRVDVARERHLQCIVVEGVYEGLRSKTNRNEKKYALLVGQASQDLGFVDGRGISDVGEERDLLFLVLVLGERSEKFGLIHK